MPPSPRAIALALAVGALCPRGSYAQPSPPERPPEAGPVDLARAAFEQGVAHAQAQQWAEALDAFERSRRLVERPRTVFNIALALHHLGREREARTHLDACLSMPATPPDLARDAGALLSAVNTALAAQRSIPEIADAGVRTEPPPAPTPPPTLPPPPIVERPQISPWTQPPPPVMRARPVTSRPWFWITLGGAAAIVVTAVVLGVVLQSPTPDGGSTMQVLQALDASGQGR